MIGVVAIPLANGKGVALIDADDYAIVSAHKWHRARGYATAGGKRGEGPTTISMHRVIMNAPSGVEVDHVNGVRNDNRRCNLRLVSRRDNMKNKSSYGGTSQFKGVSWRARDRAWVAQISLDGKKQHIAQFSSELDAAWHYNHRAKELFGEFARLNDIGGHVPMSIKEAPRKRRSKYRHVSWSKTNKRWAVAMVIDGRHRFVCQFVDEDEAGKCAVETCRARGGTCC